MQDFEFVEQLESARYFHERLSECFLRDKVAVRAEIAPVAEVICKDKFPALSYQDISLGSCWGKAWDNAVFRLSFKVPEHWEGKTIALRINLGGEFLLFSEELKELAGLTDASCFARYDKTLYRLHQPASGGRKMFFYCDAAANNLYGVDLEKKLESGEQKPSYAPVISLLEAGIFDAEVWKLLDDVKILISLAESLADTRYPSRLIVHCLDEAQAVFKENPDNAAAAGKCLKKIFDLPGALPVSAAACGHGHIDIGWLWRVKESIRKAARTFCSQLDLMDRYADYIFCASQPQLYAFIKEYYPDIYARIKERVKEGRWEVQGGMWVEADTNISSPESLIRQFIHGKNFFMDEFGIDVKCLWIPDVFGYSPVLPQITLLAGCDSFLTQKISWSQINVFPHHTFFWQGIDGSRVLTHFPPENTYTSSLLPGKLREAVERFRENDILDEFLVLYGIGDGGGGPCDSHVEHGIRAANLITVPQVKFSRTDAFFERLHKKCAGLELPVWNGELYLENHRGTLTSQAVTKQLNRQLEYALCSAETVWALSDISNYPVAVFDGLWKSMLTRQFHDILPGSSIAEVYQDCKREAVNALKKCRDLMDDAVGTQLEKDPDSAVYFNVLSYDAEFMVDLPNEWEGAVVDGKPQIIRKFADKKQIKLFISALSSREVRRGSEIIETYRDNSLVLDNGLLRAEFAENGELTGMYDYRQQRYTVLGGNRLIIYNDHPNQEDAWNINHNYMTKAICRLNGSASRKDKEKITVRYSFGNSSIQQEIRLADGSGYLEFNNRVCWHENHRMLRMELTADIHAAEAEFDLQYGFLKRPVYCNTTWDMAKFECSMHRYAALRDSRSTVALLNDSKYGIRVHENIIDMALLRSTKFPDSSADMEEHEFKYAFYSGDNQVLLSRPAGIFNRPPLLFAGYSGEISAPFKFDSSSVELTVIKHGEKSEEMVLRMVECGGRYAFAKLTFNEIVEYQESDILEWHRHGVSGKNDFLELDFTPFEIKTLRIKICSGGDL